MRTRATRDGDNYVLNGAKTFVTNAPVADLFVVYATIDPALGPMGITAFVVERDRPGLNIGKHMEKMGLRTSPMAEVVLEDCVVPAANRLGREGRGVEIFECSMEWERGCILASCLGVMRRQLERCIQHGTALYALSVFDAWGVPTVNRYEVAEICTGKYAAACTKAGIS